MTYKFILWAQALDNTSPDHFRIRGKDLQADDTAQRQEAVSLVSTVIKNGVRIFEQGGVLLTVDAHHFVIEIPSSQLDRVGRTAPVVCYGVYDPNVGEAFVTSATVALDDFAKRLGRTLQSGHLELAHASFEVLKKKSWKTKRAAAVCIGAGGLMLLAIAYWLTQGSS